MPTLSEATNPRFLLGNWRFSKKLDFDTIGQLDKEVEEDTDLESAECLMQGTQSYATDGTFEQKIYFKVSIFMTDTHMDFRFYTNYTGHWTFDLQKMKLTETYLTNETICLDETTEEILEESPDFFDFIATETKTPQQSKIQILSEKELKITELEDDFSYKLNKI
jgi:hypothetical protein